MATAHVKGASGVYSGTGSATATFASPVSAGNLIVVFVGVNDISATINTPTDSAGNTYTAMDTTTGQNSRTKGFYAKNIAAGAGNLAVTVTLGGTGYGSVIAHEVSGCDTTAPLDQKVGNAQTNVATTANAITSTAVTTTTDGQHIVGVTTQDNVESIAVAQGTDFSLGVATNNSGQVGESEYKTTPQASAGSIAVTFTAGTTGKNWVTQIATFKAAGGAASILPLVARDMANIADMGGMRG